MLLQEGLREDEFIIIRRECASFHRGAQYWEFSSIEELLSYQRPQIEIVEKATEEKDYTDEVPVYLPGDNPLVGFYRQCKRAIRETMIKIVEVL